MSQKKANIAAGVIKFSSHKIPQFKEVQGNDWVLFGKNNDYPNYLLTLYNRSAKHNAILNGKATYILGKGWEAKKAEEQALVEEFFKYANPEESLNQVSFKAILDLELFGGMAIEVVWNMGSSKAEYRHIDFSTIRSNKDNTIFYYTKNWFKKYTLDEGGESNRPNTRPDLEEDWMVYEPYNPAKKTGKQLFYFKQYRPGLDVYPLPEYLGAVPWIEIDFEIANFHYNNVKNGFTATHLLKFFNGIPSKEKQKEIEQGIKDKFSGPDNAGRFVTSYSDGKDKGSEVETLTMSDIDKQFEIIGKTVQQEVFTGHNITSGMLFGIKTEGQLGGRTEIIEANELFQNTYINKKQQLVEIVFNELARANGITAEIKLTHLEPIGLDWFSTNISGILTDDEKREKAGLKPVPKDTTSTAETTANAIATLSPLVANNVISSMTTNEIRALAADRKSTRLNSSHIQKSRMPSSA